MSKGVTEILIDKLLEGGVILLGNLFRINATVKAGGELGESDRALLKTLQGSEEDRFERNAARILGDSYHLPLPTATQTPVTGFPPLDIRASVTVAEPEPLPAALPSEPERLPPTGGN